MPRFLVSSDHLAQNRFVLSGSEARHASLVLRKKLGDIIDLFDGKDKAFQGKIQFISADRVAGLILAVKPAPVGGLRVTLYQGLLKGPKWDWLIEKACEIGVHRLVPVISRRTVVKPTSGERGDHKQYRWDKIALAAAKQCGRTDVMEIVPPLSFEEAVGSLPRGMLTLIPWEKADGKTIRQAAKGFDLRESGLFIGPEGGWDSEEVDLAVRAGAIPVTLGPTLLRSETAGIVAAALILAEWNP